MQVLFHANNSGRIQLSLDVSFNLALDQVKGVNSCLHSNPGTNISPCLKARNLLILLTFDPDEPQLTESFWFCFGKDFCSLCGRKDALQDMGEQSGEGKK